MKGVTKAALYMRLSKDDEQFGDSISIETQRSILSHFVKEHGFSVFDEYVDDGWTGTNFDRPNFKRMMDDMESGKINCIVTKDLSRFGREHIQTDFYIECIFPEKSVRFIAIHDNVDTANGVSDLVAIKNLFNEWYPKETSRKVKAAFTAKHANGETICTYAPIGYKKDPEQKNHLIVDEETRWIVEKIFDMAAHGMGAAAIVKHLIEDKVPTSAWLNFQNNGSFAHIFEGQPESKRYQWTINQVKLLLGNEAYIGNFVYGRQAKVSYKSKKRIRTAPEEWTRLEGTHEAIIDKDVFDLVQQQIQKRHRSTENDTVQMFSGLLRCADCGWSMRYHQKKSGPIVYRAFNCTAYSHLGKASNCANHYIRYEAVYTCVLSRLQYWIAEAQKDEQGLLKRLLHAESREKKNSNKKVENDLKAATRRLQNIDKLFAKLYEDHILEAITERNFSMLSEKYQQEQEELNSKIAELTKLAEQDKQDSDNAQKWVSLIRQYTNLEELNAELLNTLIDKIIIHTATKDKDGNREQEIEIFYRFVGKIDA